MLQYTGANKSLEVLTPRGFPKKGAMKTVEIKVATH